MEKEDVRRWTDEEFYALYDENRIKHKVRVFNREDFEDYVKDGLKDNEAYIDIYSGPMGYPVIGDENTYDCDEGIHQFNGTGFDEPVTNVLRLNFEDLPEDMLWEGCQGKYDHGTITHKDAKRTVLFIERNEGKDFIIHCDAGVSRSQQVGGYILITKWWDYEYDDKESTHSHHLPNTIVLTRLLMAKHRYIPGFTNRDNKFEYNSLYDKWIEKSYSGPVN